jgi:hypothetical protein
VPPPPGEDCTKVCLYALDPDSAAPAVISPAFTPAAGPSYVYAVPGAGTDLTIASASKVDGYAMATDENTLAEADDVRTHHWAKVDSTYKLGDGSFVGSYLSGSMDMPAVTANHTHFVAYSKCEALGLCSGSQKVGSACKVHGSDKGGYCFESEHGELACGRTIETISHFGPSTLIGYGATPYARKPGHLGDIATVENVAPGAKVVPCPRGSPIMSGAHTGSVTTASRFPYGGCMDMTDANYDKIAEVHVPQKCATKTGDYMKGCLFPGARNYMPGSKQSGRCFYDTRGCTDSNAHNYNSEATEDDGSCIVKVFGCTLGRGDGTPYAPTGQQGSYTGGNLATTPGYQGIVVGNQWKGYAGGIAMPGLQVVTNFDALANALQGCIVAIEGCMDSSAANYDVLATTNTNSWCVPTVTGCMDPTAKNYGAEITVHSQALCSYHPGCNIVGSVNYDPKADHQGSRSGQQCYGVSVVGCLDQDALNFGCKSYATTKCQVAGEPYLSSEGVTNHDGNRCFYAGSTFAVAASVGDLLALVAGDSTLTTTEQIAIVMEFIADGEPCDVTGAMLETVQANFKASLEEGGTTIDDIMASVTNCNRRRLGEETFGRQLQTASTGFSVQVVSPAASAAATNAMISSNFTSSSQLTGLFTGTGVTVLSDASVAVFYYSPKAHDENNTGAIVGGVIGGIIAVLLIVGLVTFIKKTNMQKTTTVVPA